MNEQSTAERVEALRKQLEHQKARYSDLKESIKLWEDEIENAKEELRQLRSWGGGEIVATERELKEAERELADETRPAVVWKTNAYPSSKGCVVEKVTAKRIFVRERGASHIQQFDLDGWPVSRWKNCQIDVEATLAAMQS